MHVCMNVCVYICYSVRVQGHVVQEPKEEDARMLRNVDSCNPSDTASHPRRPETF
jgi:hypothetical protein